MRLAKYEFIFTQALAPILKLIVLRVLLPLSAAEPALRLAGGEPMVRVQVDLQPLRYAGLDDAARTPGPAAHILPSSETKIIILIPLQILAILRQILCNLRLQNTLLVQ
jgi:hypothetical protein